MGVPAVELELLGSITAPAEGRRIRKGDGAAPSGRGRSTRACPASCSGSPWAGPSARHGRCRRFSPSSYVLLHADLG
jgi:hypothetical protein